MILTGDWLEEVLSYSARGLFGGGFVLYRQGVVWRRFCAISAEGCLDEVLCYIASGWFGGGFVLYCQRLFLRRFCAR